MTETLYVLMVILAGSGDEPGDTFAIDHGLTYENCQRRVEIGPIFTRPTIRKFQSITMECLPDPDHKE